jgi:hypothetical protein
MTTTTTTTPEHPHAPMPAATVSHEAGTLATNVMAIIALVSAFLVPIAPVVCGHIALAQIRRTGERGRGMALAGLILGYIGVVVLVLWVVLTAILLIAASLLSASDM